MAESRKFKAVLANGKAVTISESGDSATGPAALASAPGQLSEMLASEATTKTDLLRFVHSVLAAIIPSCDPSKPIEESSIMNSTMGVDFVYHRRGAANLGVAQVKSARLTHQEFAKAVVEQSRHLVETISYAHSKLSEAYIVAGRREEPALNLGEDAEHVLEVINWLTWDDVVDLLVVQGEDQALEVLTVVVAEIVDSCRRLLRLLIERFDRLSAIDHRRFEELVATLLHDVGFSSIELTPAGPDGGRDIIAEHRSQNTGNRETYLIECKHWLSGKKVHIRYAVSLLDVVRAESANGGVLLSSAGFGPRLLECEGQLRQRHLYLRDASDLREWLSIWERTYGRPLATPVDPLALFTSV